MSGENGDLARVKSEKAIEWKAVEGEELKEQNGGRLEGDKTKQTPANWAINLNRTSNCTSTDPRRK
jgi:hypothetical protein